MEYVASLSCGKDSLAMTLRLMEEDRSLNRCVFYDTGAEFKAVYNNLEKLRPLLENYGCKLDVLKPPPDFFLEMLARPVNQGKKNEHYGYEWCGGCTRWRTAGKVSLISKHLAGLGNHVQYVGIAADEPSRARRERNKLYPLVEWGMTEDDCLEYCRSHGWNWKKNGVELYSIFDKVSC